MWRVGLEARGFALGLVTLVTVFNTLWVGIGAGIHKNFETPTPVRYSTSSLLHHVLTRHHPHSIIVGSAHHSRENA